MNYKPQIGLVPADIFRRGAAFLLDCLLILMFAVCVLLLSLGINHLIPFHEKMGQSYLFRHGISLVTLTLPVILFFTASEKGRHRATPGKRWMNLQVIEIEVGSSGFLLRNILKFLPWEVAHTTYNLYPDFFLTGVITGNGEIVGMSLSYLLMLVYIATVLFRKDKKAPHDLISGTQVIKN